MSPSDKPRAKAKELNPDYWVTAPRTLPGWVRSRTPLDPKITSLDNNFLAVQAADKRRPFIADSEKPSLMRICLVFFLMVFFLPGLSETYLGIDKMAYVPDVQTAYDSWGEGWSFEGMKDRWKDVVKDTVNWVSSATDSAPEPKRGAKAPAKKDAQKSKKAKASSSRQSKSKSSEKPKSTSDKKKSKGTAKADAYGDMNITIEEFGQRLLNLTKKEKGKFIEESLGGIMKEFDTNEDGKISMKEMLPGDGSEAHLSAIFQYWKYGFKVADADKDKLLTAKEFAYLLGHLSKRQIEDLIDPIGSIMKGFDIDKNGKISLQELLLKVGEDAEDAMLLGWRDSFALADGDADGQLNTEELIYLLNNVDSVESQETGAADGEPQLTIEDFAHHLKQLSKQETDMVIDQSVAWIMKEFDIDENGKVSLKEILPGEGAESHLSAMFPYSKAAFKASDADKDAYLSTAEFAHLLKSLSKERLEELLDPVGTITKEFDTDKNGKISLPELQKKFSAQAEGGLAGMLVFAGWKETFNEADADNDGQLTADDLVYLLNHVGKKVKEKEKSKKEDL